MKINIISSTRADFGLLKNLIARLKKEKSFSTSTIIGGTHFAKRFDYTYKEIIKNKIKINNKIVFKSIPDSILGISKVFSKSLIKSVEIFKKDKPDLLIVLGDRYEILASVIAANLSKIPVAHIHGGEVTEGVIDDGFRHSITKMSHIHFVANSIYKKRVIQLGENKKNIFTVGGPGIDSIMSTKLIDKKTLQKKFKVEFQKKNYLVNFHPETSNDASIKNQLNEIFSAFKILSDCCFIFTMPGADYQNSIIEKEIKNFVTKNKKAYFFKSLGQLNYFSFLKVVNAVIGNSSSGILEAPYFKKPTINLGDRQNGRLMSPSIISIKIKKNNIIKALEKIEKKSFKKRIKYYKLYGNKGASGKIIKILKNINIKKIFKKRFYDI